MSPMQAGPDRNERTLGQLVASATQDLSTIFRGEIALAKAELSSQVKKAGLGGVLLAGAGVLGFYSVYFVFITIAEGITAAGLPKWLSYLIVTVFFLLVAGVLALIGIRRLKTVKPKPEAAIAEANQTVAALKRATSNPYVPTVLPTPLERASTPVAAAHASPVNASSAPGIAPGSMDERIANERIAEARAAAPGPPAPAAAPPTQPMATSEHAWEETAADALASDTGVEGPADLTENPVIDKAPSASTAALPRTRAEAKAQAEAKAKAEAEKHRHNNHPEA